MKLLMVLIMFLNVNLSFSKTQKDDIERVKKRVEKRRIKRKLKKLKTNNKGQLLLFYMSEWARKPRLDHLELYPKNEVNNKEKLIKIPLLDRYEVSVETVEDDVNPAMYQFGAIGGLLGFSTRGNRKQAVYGSVYLALIDLDAGEHDFVIKTSHKKNKHKKSMNLDNIKIKAGEISLYTHHWGNDRLFHQKIANTISYEEALDKYLAKYSGVLKKWPYEKLMSNNILKVKLDLDYKERAHAQRPKVVLHNAKLYTEFKSFPARVLYNGIKSFGKGDNRYTHTYYTLEFDNNKLDSEKCYSLELDGVATLNGMEVKKFDGDVIQSENLICPEENKLIEVKGDRVTGSTWELKLK